MDKRCGGNPAPVAGPALRRVCVDLFARGHQPVDREKPTTEKWPQLGHDHRSVGVASPPGSPNRTLPASVKGHRERAPSHQSKRASLRIGSSNLRRGCPMRWRLHCTRPSGHVPHGGLISRRTPPQDFAHCGAPKPLRQTAAVSCPLRSLSKFGDAIRTDPWSL